MHTNWSKFVVMEKINHSDIREIKQYRNDEWRYPLERVLEKRVTLCSRKLDQLDRSILKIESKFVNQNWVLSSNNALALLAKNKPPSNFFYHLQDKNMGIHKSKMKKGQKKKKEGTNHHHQLFLMDKQTRGKVPPSPPPPPFPYHILPWDLKWER